MDTLYEVLEGMSMNKFNVMHWHIVDEQSFPYGSEVLPNLPSKGSYFPTARKHIYSIDQVKSVIEYARQRGIRVIPEFDTPGHVRAWGKGQPGLLTKCCDKNGTFNGNYGPADPTNEENYHFMETLFTELRQVFQDEYIHLGGDEVGYGCWQSNPNITAWMKEQNITTYQKLEEYWVKNILDISQKQNFEYVVWEEVFNNGIDIAEKTVVEVWLPYNPKSETYNVTKAGYRAIISAPWYLDLISYGSDWHSYYNYEPLDFNGTQAQQDLVMGGEACLWSEYADASNYVSRLFPRASAVSERLWSASDVTDLKDAERRIVDMRCKMVIRGIHSEPANGPLVAGDYGSSACPVEFNAKYKHFPH